MAVPTTAPKIRKHQRAFNQGIGSIIAGAVNQNIGSILGGAIPQLQGGAEDAIKQLAEAVEQLQQAVEARQKLGLATVELDPDGLPKHGSYCELLDGQYLRLENETAGTDTIEFEHGLGRIPQGAIFVRGGKTSEVLISADDAKLPSKSTCFFELTGAAGDIAIAILF